MALSLVRISLPVRNLSNHGAISAMISGSEKDGEVKTDNACAILSSAVSKSLPINPGFLPAASWWLH
jgi:hypothetical protein